jgi:heme/copper-type cytochrome/quinol oxidase subunit 2
VVLALSSNTAVWQWTDDTEQTFDMEITGKQWFWEYKYKESLTWEDEPATTSINVTWSGTTLLVTSSNDAAVNVSVVKGSESFDSIALDTLTGNVSEPITYDPYVHSIVEVTDADGNVLHTWMHIPQGHMFSSALGEDMILPCDQRVVFEMHSAPSDDSNPNYIGVQHSFWLPEWGVKEDLVPGIEGGTYMTVEPDDPGTYPIRCAEYCGNQHSMMVGQVTVVAMEGSDCSTDSGVKKTKGAGNGGDY